VQPSELFAPRRPCTNSIAAQGRSFYPWHQEKGQIPHLPSGLKEEQYHHRRKRSHFEISSEWRIALTRGFALIHSTGAGVQPMHRTGLRPQRFRVMGKLSWKTGGEGLTASLNPYHMGLAPRAGLEPAALRLRAPRPFGRARTISSPRRVSGASTAAKLAAAYGLSA